MFLPNSSFAELNIHTVCKEQKVNRIHMENRLFWGKFSQGGRICELTERWPTATPSSSLDKPSFLHWSLLPSFTHDTS